MRALALLMALMALGHAAPARAQQPATPIPEPLAIGLPGFQGAAAKPSPLPGPRPRANPRLASDGRSGSGLAPGNGAASPLPGPLGHGTTSASALLTGTCASLAFDARDRLLALCNGAAGTQLRLLDPTSLATIASLMLPARGGAPDRADFAGGTHFVVRADGSLLVPGNDRTLLTVAVEDSMLRRTGAVALPLAPSERPLAVGAGFDGHDWVVGNQGTVVAIDAAGEARALALGEPVFEDLATHPRGTFVVTRDALYRLRLDGGGTPRVLWRQPLPVGGAESGRLHAGSGTPPAIVAGRYVAVADGLNRPRINVVRISGPARRRLACALPVFTPGFGSIEAHLVVAGRSIVAANAHGYAGLASTEGGATTTGGIVRVVVGRRGCRRAWRIDHPAPTAQAVVSRANGLLYTLVKPAGFPDAWNLAAIDWRTGETRFQVLAGEGLGHNPDGSAVVLGPDGAAYSGAVGGVIRFGDAPR